MKKLFLSLLFSLFIVPIALAGECVVITDVDDYWVKVTTGVNIRDAVCDGNVIGSLAVGTVVQVTGEIEGWRHIQTPDGGVGFVWGEFVEVADAPVAEPVLINEEQNEPLYDVAGHVYETAIRYLADNEIVQGYPDGSYLPDQQVNRAEFTKIIVGAKLGSEPVDSATSCFPDVQESDWFASYVCYAKENGIIAGYPDGDFRPADYINLAEAAKILVNTLEVPRSADDTGSWYAVFIRSMQEQGYIPDSFEGVGDMVTRGQMAEMIYRIMENLHEEPAKTFSLEKGTAINQLLCADQESPASVDMAKVREAWFGWVNGARDSEGKQAYADSLVLDATAQAWSDYMAEAGNMTHMRPGSTGYYDYNGLVEWFQNFGVTFANVNGWTFSENIGRTYLNCTQSDCTQQLISASKQIFDAYMAELGTDYTAHYDSVMSAAFNEMGVAWSFSGSSVYVTVHYAAKIDQSPELLCN